MVDKKAELLSPGGSYNSVVAAVNCGCDAVYLGGKNFSARSTADNFDENELKKIIDYCHLRGIKVFLTINTLYKDSELKAVSEFAAEVYSFGIDAFIMQDIGLFSHLKKILPDVDYHASTQMTAHSLSDALFLQNIGFKRIVLSRELSRDEIRHISENCTAETEVFIHGALCYSYSGTCLMSSFYGGRSGNRGQCAQPCRLKYDIVRGDNILIDDKYLLSPKDLMTLDTLEELVNTGVTSLKIEGRLKSPEYVGVVTESYRQALDSIDDRMKTREEQAAKKRLAGAFNRGGFTNGFLSMHSGADMMCTDSPKHTGIYVGTVKDYDRKTGLCTFISKTELVPGDGLEFRCEDSESCGTSVSRNYSANDKVTIAVEGRITVGCKVYKSYDKALNDYAKKMYEGDSRSVKVNGSFLCETGKNFSVTLSYNGLTVTQEGDIAQKAENQPLSDERLIAQLKKSGEFPFEIEFSEYRNDNMSFMNISSINDTRRKACEKLANEIISSFRRKTDFEPPLPVFKPFSGRTSKEVAVSVRTKEQFNAALEVTGLNRIYCESFEGLEENIDRLAAKCHSRNVDIYVCLLTINRLDYTEKIAFYENSGIDGYLVRTIGQLELLKNTVKKTVLDFTLNDFNRLSNEFFLKYADTVIPSTELAIDDLSFCVPENELLIYGRIPVMTTANCPIGVYVGEKGEGRYCRYKNSDKQFKLRDRMNMLLPIVTECEECYAQLLGDRPLFMIKKLGKLDCLNAGSYRLMFTDESGEYVKLLTEYAVDCIAKGYPPQNSEIDNIAESGITYGHYFKGTL